MSESGNHKETSAISRDQLSSLKLSDIKVGGRALDPSGESSEQEGTVTDEEELEDQDGGLDEGDDSQEEFEEDESEASEESQESDESQDSEIDEESSETEEQKESAPVNTEEIITNAIVERSNGRFNSIDEMLSEIDNRVELGDNYIRKAVEYYSEHGNLTPFLEATKNNFKEMTDVEILRYKHDQGLQGMSKKARDAKFLDVLKKYKLDDDDAYSEDEVEIGKEELQFDAKRIREESIKQQEEFLKPKSEDAPAKREQQEGPSQEELVSQVKGVIVDYAKDGKIKVKVGDSEVNFDNVDVDMIAKIAVNPNAMSDLFVDTNPKTGKKTVRWGDLIEAVYFIQNKEQYNKDLVNAGKSSGISSVEKELKNPSKTKDSGRATKANFDNSVHDFSDAATKDAFLQAALDQKRR